MALRNIIVVITFLGAANCIKLPSYIHVCRRSDPQLEECAIKNANEALPEILKGNPAQNFPRLVPFKISQLILEPAETLKLYLNDIELHGLDTVVVKDITFDFENKHCSIVVDVGYLNLIGQYRVDGRILILPLVGSGPANFTFVGGKYKYEFDYSLILKHGKEYIKFGTDNLEFTTKRSYFYLGNLFNGDRRLGDQMNLFLEESWREVQDELHPSFKKTISIIVKSIASSYFSRVSFDQLFLP